MRQMCPRRRRVSHRRSSALQEAGRRWGRIMGTSRSMICRRHRYDGAAAPCTRSSQSTIGTLRAARGFTHSLTQLSASEVGLRITCDSLASPARDVQFLSELIHRLLRHLLQSQGRPGETLFRKQDRIIVWRQRILRYFLFCAVLAGAGVGAGLSFNNGACTAGQGGARSRSCWLSLFLPLSTKDSEESRIVARATDKHISLRSIFRSRRPAAEFR